MTEAMYMCPECGCTRVRLQGNAMVLVTPEGTDYDSFEQFDYDDHGYAECVECDAHGDVATFYRAAEEAPAPEAECCHCGRTIRHHVMDGWVDPEATGDDRIWRETCDANHRDRIAAHEPVGSASDA